MKSIPKTIQQDDYLRSTFLIKRGVLEKLRGIAYWTRQTNKAVIEQAVVEFIERYEKKHGKLKVPKRIDYTQIYENSPKKK